MTVAGLLDSAASALPKRRLSQFLGDPCRLIKQLADQDRLEQPHAGLDEQGRAVLEDVVQTTAGAGCTVMLASHELDLARSLATREVRVVGGQVHAPASGRGVTAAPPAPAAAPADVEASA